MITQDGCTALFGASERGHVAVVQLLLQRHADVRSYFEVSLKLSLYTG